MAQTLDVTLQNRPRFNLYEGGSSDDPNFLTNSIFFGYMPAGVSVLLSLEAGSVNGRPVGASFLGAHSERILGRGTLHEPSTDNRILGMGFLGVENDEGDTPSEFWPDGSNFNQAGLTIKADWARSLGLPIQTTFSTALSGGTIVRQRDAKYYDKASARPIYVFRRNDADTQDVGSPIAFIGGVSSIQSSIVPAVFPTIAADTNEYHLYPQIYTASADSSMDGFVRVRYNSQTEIESLVGGPMVGTRRLKFRFYLSNAPERQALDISPETDNALRSTNFRKLHLGPHRPIGRAYIGSQRFFQQGATPTITSFTVAPTTIDLDTRPSGNITLTFGVTNSTRNSIHHKDTGQNIPLTTSTTAIIAQPDKPTTYVLVCTNDTGSISREVTVGVTKNAGITNFRRTGFYQSRFGTSSGTYRFGARITGLPQPVLTYRFSTGEQGSITTRHLTRVDDNTWDLTWTIYLGSLVSRSMTLTATNASNTTSATIANINN